MLYWTDISRGMKEIPFVFMPVSENCELRKQGGCIFKDAPSCVCSLGFTAMTKCGCVKVLKVKKDEVEE